MQAQKEYTVTSPCYDMQSVDVEIENTFSLPARFDLTLTQERAILENPPAGGRTSARRGCVSIISIYVLVVICNDTEILPPSEVPKEVRSLPPRFDLRRSTGYFLLSYVHCIERLDSSVSFSHIRTLSGPRL